MLKIFLQLTVTVFLLLKQIFAFQFLCWIGLSRDWKKEEKADNFRLNFVNESHNSFHSVQVTYIQNGRSRWPHLQLGTGHIQYHWFKLFYLMLATDLLSENSIIILFSLQLSKEKLKYIHFYFCDFNALFL